MGLLRKTDNVPSNIQTNRKKPDLKFLIHRGSHKISGIYIEPVTNNTQQDAVQLNLEADRLWPTSVGSCGYQVSDKSE